MRKGSSNGKGECSTGKVGGEGSVKLVNYNSAGGFGSPGNKEFYYY